MSQPQIKSRRQHIRLWFEFYKLALSDPTLAENIEKSRNFYAPWGDCLTTKFDVWWKEHADLFGATAVEVISRVKAHPNVLNVAIPLNLPVSKTLRAVEELVEAAQKRRLLELGINPRTRKSKATGFGDYEFTAGVEIRGKTLNEDLIVYSIWLSLNRPAINPRFGNQVVKALQKRPRAAWMPKALKDDSIKRNGEIEFSDEQIRQLRRHVKRGEAVCKAVSRGEFPGRSRI